MKRYLELVDALGLAVIGTDRAGTITHWNAAAEALYGWRAEEVAGRNVVEVTPSDVSREKAAEIMSALAAGEVWSGEFSVRDRSGRSFLVAVTDVPFDRGTEVTEIVGISAPVEGRSAVGEILKRVTAAAQSLWPDAVALEETGLDRALARVHDPLLIQLLAVLLRHELRAVDAGGAIDISASPYSESTLDAFHVFGGEAGVYVRLARRGLPRRETIFREVRAAASSYVGALVRLAGGKLFIGGPRATRSVHLLLPAA